MKLNALACVAPCVALPCADAPLASDVGCVTVALAIDFHTHTHTSEVVHDLWFQREHVWQYCGRHHTPTEDKGEWAVICR
jgi:hypothetical protein